MKRGATCRPRAAAAPAAPPWSLAALHPAIAAQWHPTKNGSLTPADVVPRSSQQVFWLCPKHPSYVWQTQVYSRLKAKGCAACAGQAATPETCLRARRPDVAARWHPTLNGTLTPDDVMPNSTRKAFWQCDVKPEHVWEARVGYVTKATCGGCPFCSGKRVTPETSLLGRFPALAAEWHPTGNGALGPGDVTCGTPRRVLWRCRRCEHAWWATVVSRTAAHGGCPACLGRVATPKTSLRALYPHIAQEWDPDQNGSLTPDDVRPGSNRRIVWRCLTNPSHVWTTNVLSRTSQATGCPFCARRFVTRETSLAALHPRLAREWHREKNAPLTPWDVLPGHNGKVWWRCSRDRSHVWQSMVSPRALKGVGCPCCRRLVATPKTSLAALHPDVAREWHPTDNAPLTPDDVVPGSGKKVWWQCRTKSSHAWQAAVYNRTVARGATGCPMCSNRIVTPETSLRGLRPDLAAEWHPTKNRPLTPDDVVPGSNRKVWWRCQHNRAHVWATVIANRSRLGHGCPFCSGRYGGKKKRKRPAKARVPLVC